MQPWPASMPDAVRHRHATLCTAKHFERSVRKAGRRAGYAARPTR